jgi:two-component system response regulator DevR
MISILLVEHPPAVRRTLCVRLEIEPDLTLVGEADDLDSALVQGTVLRPHVIVLDAEMAGLDMARAAEQIAACCPASAVVVLGLDTAALKRRLASSAAVVSKLEGAGALLAAIRSAASSCR